MMTLSHNKFERRHFLAAAAAFTVLPTGQAAALNTAQAKQLINNLVTEINDVINSGKSETAMYKDFERIFSKYAYVSGIARSVLGPPARSASTSQLNSFTAAFNGYISRKYGKRFREFIGGKIEVREANALKSFFQVKTTAVLKGMAPFDVTFMVSDVSGKDLFFDMLIEGISLLKAEKSEVGAMLDKRKGSLTNLIADLKKAG
jgi:phospholipid transport system substrate-binding protein